MLINQYQALMFLSKPKPQHSVRQWRSFVNDNETNACPQKLVMYHDIYDMTFEDMEFYDMTFSHFKVKVF